MLERICYAVHFNRTGQIAIGLLFAFIMASASLAQTAIPALDAMQAKAIIEKNWSQEIEYIPTGDVVVLRGAPQQSRPDVAKGQVTAADAEIVYKRLQQSGLIRITKSRDLSRGGFTNWNDFNRLSVQGVQAEMTVEATEKGLLSLSCPEDWKPANAGSRVILCWKYGSGTVQRIVRIYPPVTHEGKDISVVMGTFERNWNPGGAEKMSVLHGQVIGRTGKFAIAMKHDPFKGEWKVDHIWLADLDRDFNAPQLNQLIR